MDSFRPECLGAMVVRNYIIFIHGAFQGGYHRALEPLDKITKNFSPGALVLNYFFIPGALEPKGGEKTNGNRPCADLRYWG